MLKELKLQLLRWAKGVGLPALVRVTQWRRWMQLLHDLRIQVPTLGEAFERLYAGTPPELSATITMDDTLYVSVLRQRRETDGRSKR